MKDGKRDSNRGEAKYTIAFLDGDEDFGFRVYYTGTTGRTHCMLRFDATDYKESRSEAASFLDLLDSEIGDS